MLDIDNSATTTFPSAQSPERAAKIQKFLEADFWFFFWGKGEDKHYFPKILFTDERKGSKVVCQSLLPYTKV